MSEIKLDSIQNHLTGLGVPGVDSGVASRPMPTNALSIGELESLYTGDDIAATIVDELPEEAFRGGFIVKTKDEPDALLADELYRLQVNAKFIDAAKNARLYGSAFLWMIVDDNTPLVDPLNPKRVKAITQLIVMDGTEVNPHAIQADRTQPGYGEPVLYRVSTGEIVHESRFLKFTGEKLPNKMAQRLGMAGDSVLQRPWNTIRRFTDTENALARIVQSFQHSVYGISGLAQIVAGGGADLIDKRLQMIARSISIINGVVIDKDGGESYERSSSSVAGLPEIWDRFALSVARAAKMPMTKLFKQAPSGLNTDGDSGIQDWHKSVTAYREHEITPELDILIDLMFTITNSQPEEWLVEWAPLDEPSEREIAETRKIVAETDNIYLQHGVRSADQVAQSRDGGAKWSMETQAPDEDSTFNQMMQEVGGVPTGD